MEYVEEKKHYEAGRLEHMACGRAHGPHQNIKLTFLHPHL
jgi:hypothetical protein